MQNKNSEQYHDFSNVEKTRNYLIPEELPEGAYGAPVGETTPVKNKETEWKSGQRYYSAYNYEFKNLHQGLPRQMAGAHPPHDDPEKNEEIPYTTNEPHT